MIKSTIAGAVIGTIAATSVMADNYATLSPFTFDSDVTVTESFGGSVGMELNEFVAVEAGVYQGGADTWTGELTASATVGALGGVDLGGFGGVALYDLANFDVENNEWVYGAQASLGNDEVAIRARVYLEDMDNPETRLALVFNF